MLEIMGGGQGLESGLLWENNPWGGGCGGAFSNPEKLGGGDGGQFEKLVLVEQPAAEKDKKDEMNKQAAAEKVVLATTGKKRGRGGRRQKICCGAGGGDGGDEDRDENDDPLDDHENHIVTERERRKKMRTMFSTLHSMLPHLPPKADKSSIVDEAVKQIKSLEQTVQNLKKQVFEKMHGVTTINYDKNDSTRESFMADQAAAGGGGHSSYSSPAPNTCSTLTTNSSAVATFPVLFQTYTSQNVVLNVCGNQAQITVCSVKKPGLLTAICYVLEKFKLELVSAHVSSDSHRCFYMIQVHAGGMFDQTLGAFSVEEMYKQAAAEIMYWAAASA